MPLLEARGLTKRYGGVTALDDLDLAVEPRQVVGVIGPNGAGKSTLLKSVLGEVRPDTGEVWFDGARIDGWSTDQVARTGIGLAHQIPRPFRRLTVAQNVRVAALASGDRAWHGDVLETCGLSAVADRPAASLGLLDLKRLEMARALALHPRLLLLDEVGAGLVAHEVETMIEIVREVHRQGVALMVVEHVEAVIRELADQVVVIDWGKVVSLGTPAEVAADPVVREIYLGEAAAAPLREGGERRRPDSRPLLELEGVEARYGKGVALQDVDLRVHAGEVVSVLGANGAGKTTLTKVVTGLLPPSAGQLTVDGTDVTALPAHQRVRLGVTCSPEGRKIFGELTVRQNLELGGHTLTDRRDRAARLAEMFALFPVLADRADQVAGTMSGGQQQLLAMARALMSRPRLLLLDEASLGLSPVAVEGVYEAIDSIRSTGVAVLLIEQNASRSLAIADHAYVLSRGRITYDGPPDDLHDPADLETAYFGAAR